MSRYVLMLLILAGAVLVGRIETGDGRCQAAYWKFGLDLQQCPSGSVRQRAQLQVSGVRRGAKASVTLEVNAFFTIASADAVERTSLAVDAVTYELLDAANKPTPLPIVKPEGRTRGRAKQVQIPEDLRDGDYRLRATYTTRIGTDTIEAAVPLYAPARIHVLTDRPLYEPGNVVRFRAVVLRARDLAPLDGRPGRWRVTDPSGEVLLEEKAPATDWGVVAGSFPLDRLAATGEWKVAWESASASDEIRFKVEPFKLPRFRLDVTPDRPYYRAGDQPVVRGAVLYSSGAPVPGAKLDLTWELRGAWPAPLAWEESLLPRQAVARPNGRFELTLPTIPDDLQGQVSMVARIGAVDPAGDRVEGSVNVLLSEDGIAVASVTELGNGLVEGFNNRMYVRVTTPDGQVVRNTKIHVKRAWQTDDPGIEAEVDEDGVASLQIDPGPAVNIVIPAVPFRPNKKPPLVTRGEPEELIGDEGASLADQLEMDRWLVPLGACAKWVGATHPTTDDEDDGDDGSDGAQIGMRVTAGGAIVTVGASPSPLGQCVAGIVRSRRLPAGDERLYTVKFDFEDPALPVLSTEVMTVLDEPGGLETAVDNLAKSTRDCLPSVEGALPRALTWRVRARSKLVELGPWVTDPGGGSAAAAVACVQQRFGTRIELAEAASSDALGLIKLAVRPPETEIAQRPQPTTMLGYELLVTAGLEGKPSTKLRITPGEVPNLRLRVSPILATVGATVTAELFRGPDFRGRLPAEIVLKHLGGEQKAKLGDDRKATFIIEKDTEGWVEIHAAGLRSLVYVKPAADLAVSVDPAQPRYKPGDQASLQVRTRIGGKGSPAAVGLFGVDDSLSQLVPLDGPDSMGRLQPRVETQQPAFGVLDGQALTLGRIRGANAAAAVVLQVGAIPSPPELDAEVSVSATTPFDPLEELTDNFYTVLAELHLQARRWETTAPPTAKMRPPVMAELWAKALAACEQRGERVVDAYGRRLRLARLPADLLSLTDPRAVIVVGTRLPEDVENWQQWVQKEKP